MFIFSNLATTLDGKIAPVDRSFFPLGTSTDHAQMQKLRKEADAILMGASTLRTFKQFCKVRALPSSRQPMNVILSSKLEGISTDWAFFKDPALRRIFFVGSKTPASRIKALNKSSEVIILKTTRPASAAEQIIDHLGRLQINRLLVEGGGAVMWDFVEKDLIDEYHVTLTPRILGGQKAPTLVDGKGFLPADILNLKLMQCRVAGDELYLIYRKTGKRG
jgi:riboflavin-specific deaminase-like protein